MTTTLEISQNRSSGHVSASENKTATAREIRSLASLSSQLTLAQIAPLISSLFIAGLIAGFGSRAFSSYMLVSTINITIFIGASGLMQALYFLLGRAKGRGDEEAYLAAMRAANRFVWGLGAVSVGVSLLIGPILSSLGIMPELSQLAGQIGFIAAIGLFPLYTIMLFRIHAATQHKGGMVSLVYIVSALLAVVGALGVAVWLSRVNASAETIILSVVAILSLVNWLTALAAFILMRKPALAVAITGTINPQSVRTAFKELWSVGWPVAVVIFLESAVSSFSTVAVAANWPDAVPAHSVALLWVTVGLVIPLGIAQATTQKVAAANASGNRTMRNAIVTAAMSFAIIASAVAGGLLAAFPVQSARLLVSEAVAGTSPATLEMVLRFAAAILVLQSVTIVAASALRGVGITKAPLFMAAIGYVGISIVGAFILGQQLDNGLAGIWIGILAGFGCTAVGVVLFLMHVFGRDSDQEGTVLAST